MRNPRLTAKERGLLKGAARRVFSRSDLRKAVIEAYTIDNNDPERPRVTKWAWCADCGLIFPRYLAEVDHITPVIPLTTSLENMSFDTLIDNIWCENNNLQVVDKDCHRAKTKAENAERRRLKKEGKA